MSKDIYLPSNVHSDGSYHFNIPAGTYSRDDFKLMIPIRFEYIDDKQPNRGKKQQHK